MYRPGEISDILWDSQYSTCFICGTTVQSKRPLDITVAVPRTQYADQNEPSTTYSRKS